MNRLVMQKVSDQIFGYLAFCIATFFFLMNFTAITLSQTNGTENRKDTIKETNLLHMTCDSMVQDSNLQSTDGIRLAFQINYIHAPFKIAPSVTENYIHIYPLMSLNGHLEIVDVFGRKVFDDQIIINSRWDFSLLGYSSGLYYMRYISGDYEIYFKIIKL